MASPRRDQLVQTALHLFCQRGFHATGIDTILAESGVAKMTLYNHFASKDELIVAVLQLRQKQFFAWLDEAIERIGSAADLPEGRLGALFDALKVWLLEAKLNGCIFTNAGAEFGNNDNPINQEVKRYKQARIDYIKNVLSELSVNDTDTLAKQICMLLDGAIVAVQAGLEETSFDIAKNAALLLIAQQLASK